MGLGEHVGFDGAKAFAPVLQGNHSIDIIELDGTLWGTYFCLTFHLKFLYI